MDIRLSEYALARNIFQNHKSYIKNPRAVEKEVNQALFDLSSSKWWSLDSVCYLSLFQHIPIGYHWMVTGPIFHRAVPALRPVGPISNHQLASMAASVDAKLLRQTKFPPEFSRKVDMTKVNIEVMKKWIAGKISEILGNEDDVVIELCFNLLEGSRFPDVKSLQIQLTGFLDKDTAKFCKELWSLCLSAQENPQGVPKELLEAKKLELIQEKASDCMPSNASTLLTVLQIEAEKAAEEARRQKEEERVRERELEELRRRERSERGRAVIASRTGLHAASSTPIFPRVRAGTVALLDHQAAPVLPPRLAHHPLVANASLAGTETGVADRLAALYLRTETGGRGDVVLITVIELDPFPAVIPHAHVLPEETDGDGDPFLPTVHPVPLHPRTGAEKTLTPDLVLGHARKNRDDRRLSRSRSRNRDDTRRRRYSRSISRSRSRSRGRGRSRSTSSSPGRHDSRSRSRSHNREKKRRRSIQRYAPAARRRRNTSSVSVRSEKRQRMTDQEDNAAKRSSPPPEKPNSSDHEMKDPEEVGQ
ncbi:PWI domain mRNA processing protein [Aspergillus bombycis]|uniref:PWI domain mRNA processing protein n=1 Tax=Aspergillus bombycis TaxID=109264 RepID=A0A1F7ZXZ6_9EURO|nr:PWI domain mRNA processing protein [Aspergillus bombycis]OGM43945.1 PWI domain mRNA processing protein [Aspergillus bombycis]